ncbi:AAA family ATPase [Candidatus Micrarchaeota archaeon]|nr:AAA family ATPase [Candidatus Micrarchaeota archaeon]
MVDFNREMEVVYLPKAGEGSESIGTVKIIHYQGAGKAELTVTLKDGSEIKADSASFRPLDDILLEAAMKEDSVVSEGTPRVYTLTESRNLAIRVYEAAEKIIVGQDGALRQIITEILDYITNPKRTNPFLIVGKTGTGKTSSVRTVCEIMEIGFERLSTPDVSPATYKGAALQTAVYQAIERIKGKPGVLFFDEIDKLQARRELFLMLETELLKLLEPGAEVVAEIGTKTVREPLTHKIVLAGTFSRERYSAEDPFTTNLLISSGFSPEFAGRVGRIITFNDLTSEDFRRMLDLERQLPFVREAIVEFRGLGIELIVDPEAIEMLAERAARSKVGARALVTGFQTVLSRLKQTAFFGELPNGRNGLVRMQLSRHTVESALPQRKLRPT